MKPPLFRTAIASRDLGVLRVAVVFGPAYTPSTGGPGAGAEIAITNYGPPTDGFRSLGPSVKVAGGSLNPVEWTVTADQMTCTIMDQAALRALLAAGVHRGTVVEVRVTLEGDNPATEYKRVWMGRLQNIASAGAVGSMTAWTVTCYGIQAALQWRWADVSSGAAAVVGQFGLAYGGWITEDDPLLREVDATYTPGDTTLTLDAAPGTSFTNAIRTGGYGLCKVILTTGAFFYLRFTGTSGVTLTGIDNTLGFGQTDVAIGGGFGHKVKPVYLWQGHPLDVLMELLMSTGAGTNGAWDVYPAQMGMSIADELVDTTDIIVWKAAMASYTIYLVAETPITNAWQWISGWTSLMGIAVVLYEGRISVRLAQDHTDATPIRAGFGFVDSAMSRVQWTMADARNSVENVTVFATEDPDATLNATNATIIGGGLPYSLVYSLPAQIGVLVQTYPLIWDHAGYGTINDDIMERRYHWACGIGERLDLDVPHRGPAQLCPGDLSSITTAAAFGRAEAGSATDTIASADVLVVDAAAMDWGTGQMSTVGVLRYRDESDTE
jgi:hypothetical protein